LNLVEDLLILCASAFAAGAINSVAGGGTLLTFPALFSALGADAAVIANATSTTALVPGSLAGAWGYRREMQQLPRWSLALSIPSLLGGIIGSLLVVLLDPGIFRVLVPWLILTAAVLFALQPQISRWTGVQADPAHESHRHIIVAMVLQFFVSIYGGYFGAGIGILMLTVLGFMGLRDIHEMNALKSLLGSLINGVSIVVFIVYRQINWRLALIMAVAAIAGGYAGARVARRLDRNLVRRVVVAIGVLLAAYFFYGQWTAQPAG
jgi:uncharacterized membrane protein YfcA